MKKTTFLVRIFDISPCRFTQILSGRARWMWNLIPHPMSNHNAYFWWTPLPQKQEIPEKMWWWHRHHIFSGILYFWGSGVRQKYAVWVLVGCGIWFHIQWVPTMHTFDGLRYLKNRKYLKKMWWWHHHHVFSGISCFWGSEVHQKYAVWVLVGCGINEIKFCIQRSLPIAIWVKTHGDMLKIQK